jgi:hypothetical protein
MSFEIDVTHLFDTDCSRYSDSIFNSGLQNIGQITWRNACEDAADEPLVTPEQQDDLRDWIREFGAWDSEEIAAMSDVETNALLLQFIAGDIQELEDLDLVDDDEARQEACDDGTIGGRLSKCDDGRWFYSVGN